MTAKQKAPLFSIITVVKNDRVGLAATLASVSAQTFSDYEHIVIDGGSSDGTVDVIRERTGHITRWVSEPDGGIADAFNKGLRLARGEWMNFLNAGDTLAGPTILAFVVPLLPRARIITGQSSTAGSVSPPFPALNSHPLHRRAWLSHQASFIHRCVFARCGEHDTRFRICMDYEFWLRVLPHFPLHFVEKPLVDFAPGGISQRDHATWLKELYIANRLHLPTARFINARIWLRYRAHRMAQALGAFDHYRRLRFGAPQTKGSSAERILTGDRKSDVR